MKYAYYPGCSLTESAKEYGVSTLAVMAALDAELMEIPDWTCCGASAVEAVSHQLTYALPARNMALAERELPGLDILIPCSACYLNHLRVERDCAGDKRLKSSLAEIMASLDLSFTGEGHVRHLLDILANDLGAGRIRDRTEHPLTGLTVAAYYGCQALRPYRTFDDPERPSSMDAIIRALGATPLEWDMGARCCGASLMATKKDVAVTAVTRILSAARQADVVVTICPMCQMNLEACQRRTSPDEPASILYLTQLIGLAFGLSELDVSLGKNMAVGEGFLEKMRTAPASSPAPQAGK